MRVKLGGSGGPLQNSPRVGRGGLENVLGRVGAGVKKAPSRASLVDGVDLQVTEHPSSLSEYKCNHGCNAAALVENNVG